MAGASTSVYKFDKVVGDQHVYKFNNFGTRQLNGPRHLFISFCCTIRCIFEPLRVYEPGFNTDKYGTLDSGSSQHS